MKKIAIALMCMLLTAGASMAQEKKFSFGTKAGFSLTNFWGKDTRGHHDMKPNYQAGVFFEYKFTPKFGVAPEITYASQGGKFHFNDVAEIDIDYAGAKADVNFNTNYINIPVMLKFYVVPSLSIDFGPQVGINVYSKMNTKVMADDIEIEKTDDRKDNTKKVDFGVGAGLTYNVTDGFFLQARYTLGLTPVFDFKKENDIKNGNIYVGVGYRF